VPVGDAEESLGAEELTLVMMPPAGYQLERQASYAVALKLDLDDDLRREGFAREVVHAVQNARKEAGLQVEDRIELSLSGDVALLEAVRSHADYITGETLATTLELDGKSPGDAHTGTARIDGSDVAIALKRAG
jgi:isoleucyl-tRNA synthetase